MRLARPLLGLPAADDTLAVTGQNNDHILSLAPYAQRPGRDTTNDTDEIFSTGVEPAVVDVARDGNGYRAAIWGTPLVYTEGRICPSV